MTRARAALGGAPPGGSYRYRADAAAQTERRHPVRPTADRSAATQGRTISVRRSVLQAVGGFDLGLGRTPDGPLGCEETELCTRAQAHFPHGHFLLEPQAVMHHAVPAERASWPYVRARCRAEGISKARVARNVGRTAARSTERAYVLRVLSIGVLHNRSRGLHGDLAALARAGAIVAGLAFTATGFLKIRWTRPAGPPQEVGSTLRYFSTDAVAEPVQPLVIDVSSPPGAIDAPRAGQQPYASALCLLTRNGYPVTKVRLDLSEAMVADDQIDAQLRVGHHSARHHRAGAAGRRHHAEWLRGYHPAIGQTSGQHAASGPADLR
jgi:hypothetical protein